MKTSEHILELLKEGKYPTQIALSLSLSLATISYHIKQMCSKSEVQQITYSSTKEYRLTDKGLERLRRALEDTASVSKSNPLTSQKLRIHSLALAFPLRNKLSPAQPAMMLQSKGLMTKRSGLKNQESAYMQDGLLTPSSLILYLPEVEASINEDPRLAIAPYINLAITKAVDYEAKLEISLKRLDKWTLAGSIIMNHNANTNNSIAKKVLERLDKFEVKDENDKVRLIVDNSNGIPEFESVDAQNGIIDQTKAQDFYLALLQGHFDYREVHKILAEMLQAHALAVKFQASHLDLIDTLRAKEQASMSEKAKQIYAKLKQDKEHSSKQKGLEGWLA